MTPAQNTSETVDFVCVGGGLGGLAAAVRAAHAGLSVVVLEKSAYVGGVAAYSGGSVWIPGNTLDALPGSPDADSRADAERYLSYVGGKELSHDEALRAAYLERGPEAIDFYRTQAGLAFTRSALPEQYYPQAEGSTTGIRHIEVTIEGSGLGEWESRLRPGVYCDPRFTITELVAARVAGIETSALLGSEEIARRDEVNFLARGQGLSGAFLQAALAAGARIETDAPVTELVIVDGAVTGVIATVAGVSRRITATRGVLLATGSFGSAPWAASLEGLPELFEQAPPILHGDGLRLAEQTPAAVVRAGSPFTTLGFRSSTVRHPGSDEPVYFPVLESMAKPHIITVNAKARRFGDESFYGVFANAIGAFSGTTKAFDNWPAFAIMDDTFRRNGYDFGWAGAWPEADLVRADSLADLAVELGLPAAELLDEVERYNRAVDAGADDLWGRGSLAVGRGYGDVTYPHPNLGRIETAPFWGKRLHILTSGILSHGLSIDAEARVLTRDRRPIPGLFATGNLVAHAELPYGYENGFANGRNITYAYVAASTAAGLGGTDAA